jgi:hypothetical protein
MMIQNDQNGQKENDNTLSKSELYSKDLRERVFTNFIYDISEFLTKKEKLLFREVNKKFQKENFSDLQINLYLKKCYQEEDFNPKNYDITNIVKYYGNIEKLTIESLKLDEKILLALSEIIKNNSKKLNVLHINNVEYKLCELREQLIDAINLLENITEFSIGNIGNKDKLFIHLMKNQKKLFWANTVTVLSIDNIKVEQIPLILDNFPNIIDLTIQNCSLDEDLSIITNSLCHKDRKEIIKNLTLSYNGLSSMVAMEALKKILRKYKGIQKLVLRGMWFLNISSLEEEFKMFENLEALDLFASKYIYKEPSSFYVFNVIKNVKHLLLGDTKLEDEDLEIILKNLPEESQLEELDLFRNFLTNDSITHLLTYSNKLQNVKTLTLSFNQKINSKGFNILSEKIYTFPNIHHLNLRNCGISLNQSSKNLISLILNKPKLLDCIELYYCSFNKLDYKNFITSCWKKIEDSKYTEQIYLKIYMKNINPLNFELFGSVQEITSKLYRNFNLIIR